MLLTLVVPIYNMEKYLQKCLESIVENLKENNDIEVLLINDGSNDASEDICKEFIKKQNNLKYIKKLNTGCSDTRNLGIKLSKGEYICFIDSDDFIKKDYIKNIKKVLETKKDLILFGHEIFEENYYKKTIRIPKAIKTKKDLYKQSLFSSSCNKVYRVDIIKQNNIYFPINTHMGEDLAFNCKYILFVEEFYILKKVLYCYKNFNGVTNNILKRKEIYEAFDDIFKFYKEKDKFFEYESELKYLYQKHCIKFTYNSIFSSDLSNNEKEIFKRLFRLELKKRKDVFKTEFILKQLYYIFKINFINKKYLKDLLRRINGKKEK